MQCLVHGEDLLWEDHFARTVDWGAQLWLQKWVVKAGCHLKFRVSACVLIRFKTFRGQCASLHSSTDRRLQSHQIKSALPFLIWFMCQELCWLVPRGQRLGTESFHGFWWRTTKAHLSTDRSQNKACLHHLEQKEWPYCFSTDSPRTWLMNTVCCPQTQVSLNKIKSISVLYRYYQV